MVKVYAKTQWLSTGTGKRPVLFDCMVLKDGDDKLTVGISTAIDCCEIPYVEIIFKDKRYSDCEFDEDLLRDGRVVSISGVRNDDEIYNSMYTDPYNEMNNKGLLVLITIGDEVEKLYISAVNKHNGYYPHDFIIKYRWGGQKYCETGSL